MVLATLLVPIAANATVCEAKSGATTVALLELYTSEGCDSCPPADRWIAELPQRGLSLDRVVPLSLHVDYWDRLGWKDPFAQALFSQRQREFARLHGTRAVYTPEFVLNGHEYRRWSHERIETDIERINRGGPRADIGLRLEHLGRKLKISATSSLREKSLSAAAYMALYENKLRNNVGAGENRGRILQHEFVVRRFFGPVSFDTTGAARIDETFTLDPDWKPANLGVAVFVQDLQGGDVFQALALPVCRDHKITGK